MNKTKPTIRRFLHTRHDPELQAIRERLKSLFRQNDLRQRILDSYEAFDGIDGYWGRETDLWAPLLAIAQAIDHETPEWKVHEKVLGIARKDIERRGRESRLTWENKCLIACYQYLKDIRYSPDNYVVAEDIAKFVSKQLRLKYPLKTEKLGHLLRNHSLLLLQPDNPGYKVKWVRDEDGNLIQRTCYWIDMIKFSKFVKKFEKYVEYEKPTDSSEEDLAEVLCKDIDFGDGKK